MHKRKAIRKLAELAKIKQAQCEQSLAEIHIARRSKERALEIQGNVVLDRDGAADKWEACLKASLFSPETMQNRAASLLQKEKQLEQADELVAFAGQRLNNNENNWLRAELQYQHTANLEREAIKKHRKDVQEKELNEAADRFGYRSYDNGE